MFSQHEVFFESLIILIVFRLSVTMGNEDGWGQWTDYTVCSKTCGYGVQKRTRSCLADRSGSSQCHGDNMQYQSCNVQECPSGTIDFRSYQCSSYNIPSNVTNGIDVFSWRSHFDPDIPCALICTNEKEGIRQLQEVVIDGTECDDGDNFGLCINGVCKTAGCDHILGSMKIEDKCLVCGGNGETCQTVSGSTMDHIFKLDKETHISTIPTGSTKVTISMMSLAPIKLELVTQDGNSLILSNAANESGGKKFENFAGAHFRYKVTGNGIQITARGPLNDTLQLIVGKMVRLKSQRSFIEYEYSAAKLKVLKRSPHRYYWVFGSWTSCSQKCGNGYQLRAVSCIDHETGKVVSPQKCPQTEIPVNNKTCNDGICHISSIFKYKWMAGHWGECSVDCGLGDQTQIMHCIQIDVTGNSNYTSDNVCLQYVGEKPVLRRVCTEEAEYCPYWASGSWSECSVTCGFGTQSRTVFCQRDPTETAKDPIVLDDSICPHEKKPQEVQSCYLIKCFDGTNNNMRAFEDAMKPVVDCRNSMFGCCPDNITSAKGSLYFGCSKQVTAGVSVSDLCELPSDSGPCADYIIRWYFDTTEKDCLRFWYGGCNGNDNRFDDIDICRTHCLQKLPNTRPFGLVSECDKSQFGCCPNQHVPAEGPNYLGCQKKCKDSTYGCCTNGVTPAEGPNQEGCDFGSGDLPCEYTEYGCCADGITVASGLLGRGCGDTSDSEDRIIGSNDRINTQETLIAEKCTAPVSRDLCTEYLVKWRFDNGKQECVRHWWGGCKDNGNVFESQGDCEAECKNTVVIMNSEIKNQEKCTAPLTRDLCTEYLVKWRFDNGKQECVRHWWGGCKSNANVFESQEDCETECMNNVVIVNPDIEDPDFINICDMPKDVGPCTDSLLRYFYDPKDRKCEVFYYGGCQGNENNFVEVEDCQRECMGGTVKQDILTTGLAPEHETLKSPLDVCLQPLEIGPCSATIPRFFFDPHTNSCVSFLYGGCRGNSNNFDTKEACNKKCSHYKYVNTQLNVDITGGDRDLDVCQLNVEKGSCRGYHIKWYYSIERNRCERFIYTGCDGNGNQFNSEKNCIDRCFKEEVTDPSFTFIPEQTSKSSRFHMMKSTSSRYEQVSEDHCHYSNYGCCEDGLTAAKDSLKSNCKDTKFQPRASTDYKLILVKPGTDALLQCTLRGLEVLWYRDSFYLESNQRFQVYNNGTLVLKRFTEDMSGIYTCRISTGNIVPLLEKFKVQVNIPLSILPGPAFVSIKPGDNAFFHCQAVGSPQPIISWNKNGKILRSSNHYSVFNNGTLIVSSAHVDDAGEYECSAENGINPTVRRKTNLSIKETIDADIQSHQGTFNEGDTIHLLCKGSGYPVPQLEWMKEGNVLKSDGKVTVRNGDLIVRAASIEDAGMYKCIASNEQDKVEDVTTVQIKFHNPQIKCEDTIGRARCSLVVTGRLCGFQIFAHKICCQSCKRQKL